MTNRRPPTRRRKGDRMLHGGADAADVQCDYAIGPLDRLALDMDRKWGIDKLPELVSPQTAERYGTAIAQLNEALAAQDPKRAAHKAQVCMKGLHAMDAEAEAAGAPKADGRHWEYELGNFKFAIIEDDREWKTLQAKRPDLTIFTMREAALALKAYCETVPLVEAKTIWPGAEVKQLPPMNKNPEDLNDPIPF